MTNELQIDLLNAGYFLCDGGGIFGTVPKVLWSRHIKADENNKIAIGMRCLLITYKNRKVIIETGAGDKLNEKYRRNNGLGNAISIEEALRKAGHQPESITDVVHTHLHWDHCGGGTKLDSANRVVPTFPNATYHCTKAQWDNAMNPNPREDDAYFINDLLPIKESGQLHFIEDKEELFSGLEFHVFNGHTHGLIVPLINYRSHKIAYVNDLIPLVANIPVKWVSAYDLYPVTSMEEKEQFLLEAYQNDYLLLFEHDLESECATLKKDKHKGIISDLKGQLANFV